jgi:hypothetical protein
MLTDTYLDAMVGRVRICFTFATFSTFTDWLDMIFIKLQPISPLSLLYDVNTGSYYGEEQLTYRTFIRRGVKLLVKLLNGEPLGAGDYDPLAEFLIYLAHDLSANARGKRIEDMLHAVEVPREELSPEHMEKLLSLAASAKLDS